MSANLTRNTLDPARLPPSLTVKDFAQLSGRSMSTVRGWIKSGYLRATRPGDRTRWCIPRSELARVLGWEGVPA